jgi:hypothetical protein
VVRPYHRRFKDIVVENENACATIGWTFSMSKVRELGCLQKAPMHCLSCVIPNQEDFDPLDDEPIELTHQHNQLRNTWFGLRWNLQHVARTIIYSRQCFSLLIVCLRN